MKLVVALFALLAVCVVSQEAPPQEPSPEPTAVPETPLPEGFEAQIMQQVQMEEFVARMYLDLTLKLQHAQYTMMASNMIVQQLSLEYHEDRGSDSGFDRSAFPNAWGLEENLVFREDEGEGEYDDQQSKLDLLASYNLYYATKLKFLQTVFKASDVQREFWMDRVLQLSIQSGGVELPAPLYQLMYLKVFKTNLETIKLSLTFQYVSHFITWLEDAIDVGATIVDESNPYTTAVVDDQADDLIRDKIHAFTAFNSHAMVDFQIFYIDLYLESAMGGSMGSAPPAAANNAAASSFLEEEATTEPSINPALLPLAGSLGAGSMGSMGSMGSNPALFMKVYKFYYLMFQMNAAHSALTSVFAEKMAYEKSIDEDESNDEEADQYKTFAQQMYGGGFAMNLMYGSQLEYVTSIFELYSMYAMFFQGSMGGQGSV